MSHSPKVRSKKCPKRQWKKCVLDCRSNSECLTRPGELDFECSDFEAIAAATKIWKIRAATKFWMISAATKFLIIRAATKFLKSHTASKGHNQTAAATKALLSMDRHLKEIRWLGHQNILGQQWEEVTTSEQSKLRFHQMRRLKYLSIMGRRPTKYHMPDFLRLQDRDVTWREPLGEQFHFVALLRIGNHLPVGRHQQYYREQGHR